MIADLAQTIGRVEHDALIRSTLAENGNPEPEFAINPAYWGVTIWSAT